MKFGEILSIYFKILSGNRILPKVQCHNSGINVGKIMCYNPKLDLAKLNAYIKLGEIPSIGSQELSGNPILV